LANAFYNIPVDPASQFWVVFFGLMVNHMWIKNVK
jgi:hypothetical protein